ncbi:rod shape determining protein RodA [Alicyclobacillus tolerans]|uniref:Rod shape determining protein RodA n=1 Tax=Alicyclobacillus tolerans TaxID=90970 RepID=A0A1M6NQ73_9BACL|nr:rod shape determining protein RodA [Alicyclobacillus montanus]
MVLACLDEMEGRCFVETLRRNIRDMDFTVLGVLVLLAVYSCVAILAATYGKTDVGLPKHIIYRQILFEMIGWIAMTAITLYDYRSLRKNYWWIIGGAGFLLLVVFVMPRRNGAHSWIPLGPFSFQPSEVAKLAMIIGMAVFMADIDESEVPDYSFRRVWPLLIMFIVPFVLTFKEPALGQALVLLAIFVTMYCVFAKRWHFVMLIFFTIALVAGIGVVAVMYPQESTKLIENVLIKHHLLHSYQAYRIITWLNPQEYPLSYGYNIRISQIAVGSGQVFGEGLFNGIETRGNWIPNQWTDYIFTAIAEEFGFVGSSLLVLLFLILCYRLIRIAGTSQDSFGTYIVTGIVALIAFQVFENIGADMYLSPSTGITLPFISYGGSSLVIDYMGVGLALSVALRRKKLRFN